MAILHRAFCRASALVLVSISLSAQSWSVEELRARSQGFHEENLLARLRQVGSLIEQQQQVLPALCAAVHGDHREYLLKIERLLNQLADDRWFVREESERNLVETGARAIALIEARGKEGETLEERIRCQRIRVHIADRGTEDEDREIRLLRGWVATAAFMPASEQLTRALVSAVGHTDPLVMMGAVRALGAVGGDTAAEIVYTVLSENPSSQHLHQTALTALARMPGTDSLRLLGELFAKQQLSTSEGVAIIRELKQRQQASGLLAKIVAGDNEVLARCAALPIPALAATSICSPTLPNQLQIHKPFLGVGGDYLRIADLVPGLPHGELLTFDCDALEFDNPLQPLASGTLRLFLGQGSLLTGTLVGMQKGLLEFASPVFGTIKIPRAEIQGLALDADIDRLVGASGEFDRLRLGNGNFLDGELLSIDSGVASIHLVEGGQREVPVPDIAAILFKRPRPAAPDQDLYTRVDLVSGDRLLIHLAFATRSHLGIVSSLLGETVLPIESINRMEFAIGGGALWGFTLIADYSENRIIEVDDQGEVVWSLDEVFGCLDVECLDNGNLLITEYALNRVMEVTREGKEVWIFEDLKNPYDADRLANGNTLIADTYGERVIEVNLLGEIVWQYDDQIKPFDVERLANGNTLIADDRKDRVIEIDPSGKIVWQLKNLASVHDADRLANGNTLITLRMDHKVIEFDPAGNVVFTIEDLDSPSDADRLPNGHTLVAENGKVREFDRQGKVVWEHRVMWAVEVNRY